MEILISADSFRDLMCAVPDGFVQELLWVACRNFRAYALEDQFRLLPRPSSTPSIIYEIPTIREYIHLFKGTVRLLVCTNPSTIAVFCMSSFRCSGSRETLKTRCPSSARSLVRGHHLLAFLVVQPRKIIYVPLIKYYAQRKISSYSIWGTIVSFKWNDTLLNSCINMV